MDPLLQLTLAMSLGLLFAASAVHQLLAWAEWPGIVRNYRLLPEALVTAAAIAIPCSEALTAGTLLWAPTRPTGALGAALLLAVFAAAMGVNISRGRTRIDCGCFAPSLRRSLSRWMVVRNLVLAALALSLLFPTGSRALSVFEVGASLVCVATLAFLYPVMERLLGLGATARGPAVQLEGRHPTAG